MESYYLLHPSQNTCHHGVFSVSRVITSSINLDFIYRFIESSMNLIKSQNDK